MYTAAFCPRIYSQFPPPQDNDWLAEQCWLPTMKDSLRNALIP
jgi:hypothetical protein